MYQPDSWKRAYRFVALRYAKDEEHEPADQVQQYQLFETRPYRYRVFVTNLKDRIPLVGVVLQPTRRSRKPDQRS